MGGIEGGIRRDMQCTGAGRKGGRDRVPKKFVCSTYSSRDRGWTSILGFSQNSIHADLEIDESSM